MGCEVASYAAQWKLEGSFSCIENRPHDKWQCGLLSCVVSRRTAVQRERRRSGAMSRVLLQGDSRTEDGVLSFNRKAGPHFDCRVPAPHCI
jgi:hypothetical protein